MTFDEWPSPLCSREERGAEADSRWDCTQSNNMFFPSRSCSLCSLWTDFGELHGSVKWCSSAHVTFLLAGRSLCVARTKTKFLNRTMHWKITMFRVGPHHWSGSGGQRNSESARSNGVLRETTPGLISSLNTVLDLQSPSTSDLLSQPCAVISYLPWLKLRDWNREHCS